MLKKSKILLMLSLVLPVVIFLFLKFFGKNQFDLPVFYETADEWPTECSNPNFPFVINDSTQSNLGIKGLATLILLKPMDPEGAKRLPAEVDTTRIRVIQLVRDLSCGGLSMNSPFRKILIPCGTEIHCDLGAGSNEAAILADENGRIRSVFKSLEREETDRAIMEIKILLKDY